ncbi:hypothetical protein [Alicyclobacillus ferrooxydans]|uniref:Uncharacterized protein n=1 Tax=Alicyclobacillus ferrooxydans TaxID=471514 RepID=A0A0P9CMA4_9BACL|nr:hypothetical protein [Alicyclobacillus ferrooxydans]KPV44087.1 hypothetical protein AN477_08390 [Alicyclobacillus ferrooxydans]
MPIRDDLTFEYEMPVEIKQCFTKEFMTDFREKAIEVFKQNDIRQGKTPYEYEKSTYYSWWIHMEGTSGFHDAFKEICEKYDLDHVVNYYKQLPWYDADLFDSELGDLLVRYGLVELGTAEEHEISKSSMFRCDE